MQNGVQQQNFNACLLLFRRDTECTIDLATIKAITTKSVWNFVITQHSWTAYIAWSFSYMASWWLEACHPEALLEYGRPQVAFSKGIFMFMMLYNIDWPSNFPLIFTGVKFMPLNVLVMTKEMNIHYKYIDNKGSCSWWYIFMVCLR